MKLKAVWMNKFQKHTSHFCSNFYTRIFAIFSLLLFTLGFMFLNYSIILCQPVFRNSVFLSKLCQWTFTRSWDKSIAIHYRKNLAFGMLLYIYVVFNDKIPLKCKKLWFFLYVEYRFLKERIVIPSRHSKLIFSAQSVCTDYQNKTWYETAYLDMSLVIN